MTNSLHLDLPYIAAAQAQKHVTHNEALRILDALVMLAVDDRDASAPPPTPIEGARYLVKSPGSGLFAGHDHKIAHFRDGAFAFYQPQPGWLAYIIDEGIVIVFDGSDWAPVAGTDELQEITRLGLGTTADAINPLAARLNSALFSAKATTEGGTGDLRYVLSKQSTAHSLSFLFQDNDSGRAEMGLLGDDDFHVKVSTDGSFWRDAMIVAATTGKVRFPSGVTDLRETLTAPRIYYVRPDGDDANDGHDHAHAFLTIQKAVDVIFGTLDLDAFNVTIQLADGTYSAGANVTAPRIGTGQVTVQGNADNPGNVIVTAASIGCFRAASGASIVVRDMELRTTSGTNCLVASVGGHIQFAGLRFGTCSAAHIRSEIGGLVEAAGNYAIVGNAAFHANMGLCGIIRVSGKTVTLSGSPAFSIAFAYGTAGGMAVLNGNTFNGIATGKRYDVTLNGAINVQGAGVNYLPGDVAGTTATGGQYG